MYSLSTQLTAVKGVGPSIAGHLAARHLFTVGDLLLWVPSRYEDRSQIKTIAELQPNELATLLVQVQSARNGYKGRRSFQTATVFDQTGKLKLLWFNNPHIVQQLSAGSEIFISGKLGSKGAMVQATVERVSANTTHTGRLVPIYPSLPELAAGSLRRLLKEISDNLHVADQLDHYAATPLQTAFQQLHFPDSDAKATLARERLAFEELMVLIGRAQKLKQEWQRGAAARTVPPAANWQSLVTDAALPYQLTNAQLRSIGEICQDLQQPVPMNRLLVGDVGSGKTAVAGVACLATLLAGHSAALVAPTQILAEQHMATLHKLFPHMPIELVTSKTAANLSHTQARGVSANLSATLFIGTHAILHRLAQLQPALLIYDEQHRFGVRQRSVAQALEHQGYRPHVLTLSATPIPRTLMLTIFAHLKLSVIDELPAGRQPITTWLASEAKRISSYEWIWQQLHSQISEKPQALIVCPFIDKSEQEGFDHIPAASEMLKLIKKKFAELARQNPKQTKLKIALLHGRLPKEEQTEVIRQMFAKEIDILVTTPIVEVGVDLPAAEVIVIEAAERFGLASLHQMRGRVGRAGQQAYCLLFPASKSKEAIKRLKQFCDIHDGTKLAELDLERRGAGDLFGTQQHGFDELKFASWTNVELIQQAQQTFQTLVTQKASKPWKSQLFVASTAKDIPLAN